MEFSKRNNFLIILLMLVVLAVGIFFGLSKNYFFNKPAPVSAFVTPENINGSNYVPPQKLSNAPEIIKAFYVTGYSAGSKKYLDYLTNIFKTSEINAVVVDIKGSDGYVTYNSGAPDVAKYHLYIGAIKDVDALINFFHNQNIYVIGRIANFEDPVYSKARPELAIYNKLETTDPLHPILWQDKNKLSWLDPASKDVWDYNISLAKDALYHGFDEINFDYVRFPSDGKTASLGFPAWNGVKLKADVINEFFHYVRANLTGAKISVDLFGQTTTNTDDMGIGQILENAFENFDYISPMVYPSHYIDGFKGFDKPAEHPYDVVKYAMDTALAREAAFDAKSREKGGENASKVANLAKFRPWLQDFSLRATFYTADMVRAEIKATQDSLGSNFYGYMMWNAGNIYTTL